MSHRCDIYRPWLWYGHKYSEYKTCLSLIMLTFIKQHLSNIWSSTHEKVSSTEAEFKKSVAYWKKRITQNDIKRNYIRKCIFRHDKYVCINIQRERPREREGEHDFYRLSHVETHQLTILGVIQFSERVLFWLEWFLYDGNIGS